MTEIEKMFENAGVEPIDSKLEPMGTLKFSVDDIGNTWTREQYMKEVPIYPPFTAEKQLRLTTFIGLHYGFQMLKNEAFDYIIATKIFVKYELEYQGYGYGYDEAIANLINNLWQDLTEEERKQIKEILE